MFQQLKKGGLPVRVSGGNKPGAKSLALLDKIEISNEGIPLDKQIHYDKIIWSGLSWASAQFDVLEDGLGKELLLKYQCADPQIYGNGWATFSYCVELYGHQQKKTS